MNRLFVIAGASGSGKTFLLERIAEHGGRLVPIKKLSTRSARPYEERSGVKQYLDLEFSATHEQISQCEYSYFYLESRYGAKKGTIDEALIKGYSPFVIIRDMQTIREIKKDYPNAVVIYMHSRLTGEELKRKLEEQGREDIDIESRMERLERDFQQYITNIDIVDKVIINDYEPDKLIDQLNNITSASFTPRPTDIGYVFVLMSFKPEHEGIYYAIRSAGEQIGGIGLEIERIDNKPGDYKITDEVLRNIERATLIICDLTFERPNVYYELGYARGLNKTVIAIAKAGTKLHFDIRDSHTLFYDSATDLELKLREELRYHFGDGECAG